MSKPSPMPGVPKPKTTDSGTERQPGVDSQPVTSSDKLLAGASQLAILHNQTIYFLRHTRFGKLILTK